MTSPPQAYIALPLQTSCYAINGLQSLAEINQRKTKTIDNVAGQIRSSLGFITSFTGLSTKLVVLPEYFLTGYPTTESINTWSENACIDMDGPEYEALGKICQDNGIYLSGNVYENDKHFPEIYFQTSFIIDPNGDVILRYRRLISMFSPTPHDIFDRYLDVYGKDSLFPVVDTEIGRLAAVASEEILYPEITRAFAIKGAEIICHSTCEVGSPLSTPKSIAKQARAYENMVYIVSANSAGVLGIPFPAASTDGGSRVVDFHGHILAEADTGESMSGQGEINLAALRQARRRPGMNNALARQRLELFAATYNESEIYPKNNMLVDGNIITPDRQHFIKTQQDVIDKLIENEILKK